MHAAKTLWMVVTLAVVGAAALALPYATRGQNSPVAHKGPDFVSFPQVAANIVAGEKLRTTLVNTGTDTVQAVVSVFDRDGNVVKEETVTVAPGAMQTSEISCVSPSTTASSLTISTPGACPGAGTAPQATDGSTPLRTEVAFRKKGEQQLEFLVVKLQDVIVTSAVVCDTSGPTPTSCGGAGGTTGPTSLVRLGPASLEGLPTNHNETLVRDAAPME